MKQIYFQFIKTKSQIILPIILFCSFISFSQAPVNLNNSNPTGTIINRGCGSGILPQQFETWLQNITPSTSRLGSGQIQSVFNIPVIVHVIHNNEAVNSLSATTGGNLNAAQIQDQINILNKDFNGLNPDTSLIPSAFKPFLGKFQFNFCLAVVNPTGGILAEPGIDRINRTTRTPTWTAPPYSTTYIDATIKPATIWNPNKYMNMWVCGISGGVLGYATFPNPGTSGLSGLNPPYGSTTTDGLVMRNSTFGSIGTAVSGAPYNLGRTATHEIGHWLGLRHIWGDAGQCGATDFCNDTPPQRGGTASPAGANYGCPTFPFQANTCTISSQSNINGDMFMNYMDYTNDACMYMFTNDQKTRAQLIMTNSPMRLGLLTSTVCNSPTTVNDIGILFISNPTFSQNITCSTSINPSVVLYNYGTNTITTATFSYNVSGLGTQTFVWSGNIVPSTSLIVGMPTVTGLTNGNKVYNVGIYLPNGNTDSNMNNNISNQPFTIINAYNFTLGANSSTTCPNSTIAITASGGNSYTLQPGNVVLTGTSIAFNVNPSGSIVYTISASNGSCTATRNYSAFVNSVGPLTVSPNQTICAGANATLQASGATSYSWNTGASSAAIVVSPTNSTIYSVYGTSGTCVYTNTVSVSIGNIAVTINSLSLCAGNSGSLIANGANNYTWSTGSTNQSILVTPTVSSIYTVVGSNGTCAGTASVLVTILPSPTITGVPASTSICQGLSLVFNPGGACTYSYSSGSNTVMPSVSTVYTVFGTHCTSGCLGSFTMSLTVNPTPTVLASASQTNICSGSTTTLSVGGATSYSWSNGASGNAVSVNPIVSTIYTVIGFSSPCSNSTTVSVTVTPLPTISINNYTICSGGSATLTPSGASSYTWNTGSTLASIIVSPSANTVYTVTGSNSNCINTQTVSVNIGSALSIAINSPTFICSGNSATLNASGANSYTWSNGSNNSSVVANPTSLTTYSVIGASGTCTGSTSQAINVNPLPTVSLVSSPSVAICVGGSATLTATGAASYSWNNGASGSQIVVTPSTSATYSIIGTTNGCSANNSIFVSTSGSALTLTLNASSTNICAGNQATLYVMGANNYTWNNGSNSFSIVVSPTITTTYSINGSNGACSGAATKTINVLPSNPINVNANPSFSVCLGKNIVLTASGSFTAYSWSGSSSNSSSISITPTANTNYTVSAFGSSLSCASTTIISVVVNSNPISSLSITPASCGSKCDGKLTVTTLGGSAPFTYSVAGSNCTVVPCSNLCAGLYTLNTIDNAGCTNFNIFSVNNSVNNMVANITATHATCANCNDGVLVANLVGGNTPYTYSWSPSGGTAAIAASLTTGCYTLSVTDAGGCNTKSYACVGISTGIDGMAAFADEVLLFPNPTKSLLNIQLNGFVFNYQLYSSLGQLIISEKNNSNVTSVNLENLSKGIYILEIKVGVAVIRKKIMKD
jgi:hypothetical protein